MMMKEKEMSDVNVDDLLAELDEVTKALEMIAKALSNSSNKEITHDQDR